MSTLPFWMGLNDERIWKLRLAQPSTYEIDLKDKAPLVVEGHDLDFHPSGTLIVKRLLGKSEKVTAWSVAVALPAGTWTAVRDVTVWEPYAPDEH